MIEQKKYCDPKKDLSPEKGIDPGPNPTIEEEALDNVIPERVCSDEEIAAEDQKADDDLAEELAEEYVGDPPTANKSDLILTIENAITIAYELDQTDNVIQCIGKLRGALVKLNKEN